MEDKDRLYLMTLSCQTEQSMLKHGGHLGKKTEILNGEIEYIGLCFGLSALTEVSLPQETSVHCALLVIGRVL